VYREAGSLGGAIFPAPALLDSVLEITAPWLAQALRSAGHEIPDIADVHIRPLGRGTHGTVARVSLSYVGDSTGLPRRLLCKFPSTSTEMHRAAVAKALYRREVAAYDEIHRHRACRLPRLYFAAADEARLNLFLEDLQSVGVAGDPLLGGTPEQVAAVLGELASLHGCFARLSPVAAPEWLRNGSDTSSEYYRAGLQRVRRRFAQWLVPAHLALIEAFATELPGWQGYVRHSITLTHGDPRVHNVLFPRDGSGSLATLINWQLAGLRNPMYDVACLLVGSLPESVRREHERALIARYCRLFERNGPRYSLHEALEDYRYHLFSPLLFAVCAAAVSAGTRSERLLTSLLQRSCHALIEWDSLGLLRQRLAMGPQGKPMMPDSLVNAGWTS
jgi:Phosphotransferase enzyme family